MRIAISLLNRGRGSGVVARQHASGLLDRGHNVWVVHPENVGSLYGAHNVDVPLPGSEMPVHEFLPSAGERGRPVSEMPVAEAERYINAYAAALETIDDIDVYISHHGNLSSVAVQQVAQERGAPYVVFVHGTGIEPRLRGGYLDAVWERIADAVGSAEGIIVTTDYVRDELLLPLVAVDPEKILVLPVGVDLETFQDDPSGTVQTRFELPEQYVICPGALTTLKGPQNVVGASRAYADLAPTVFIGDGYLRSALTRRLGDRGRFLGFVTNAEKAELINAATILTAAPEKLEHFGIIYVEALAAGSVPVAYRGGGVDSIVTPEVGVLTERTPDALGESVRDLLVAEDRRREMVLFGRKRAEEAYAEGPLTDRLERWLADIAAEGSAI